MTNQVEKIKEDLAKVCNKSEQPAKKRLCSTGDIKMLLNLWYKDIRLLIILVNNYYYALQREVEESIR